MVENWPSGSLEEYDSSHTLLQGTNKYSRGILVKSYEKLAKEETIKESWKNPERKMNTSKERCNNAIISI